MLRLLLIIILPAYTSSLLSADKFSAENIHIFGMAHLTAWDKQYQDPTIAYSDVNKMLKTAYNGCNANSTEGEINKFFVVAQQAHYIAQTYLYMDKNFEAAAATVCTHVHLCFINLLDAAQKLPEYEYALSQIQNARSMATDRKVKLWAEKVEELCTQQMKPFMAITSLAQTAFFDKEDEASVADTTERDITDTTVERQTEGGSAQTSDENDKTLLSDTTQHTAPLSKKEKARRKQLANQARQAAERERKQQEDIPAQDVQPTAANDLGAVGARTPKDAHSGAPKNQTPQNKPSAGAASATSKKKPKQSAAAKKDKDEEVLKQAMATAEAARSEMDEKRKRQQQLAAAKIVEEEKLKAEQVLRKKGQEHYTALKVLQDRTEECAAYIKENHAEIFSCMELIFETQREDAVYFLASLTQYRCGLDYAEQKLSNYAEFLDAHTHDMYITIACYLLISNCAVDIVESFIQNFNIDDLNSDHKKACYAMSLALLVKNGRQYNLAITIFNSWIDNPSFHIQRSLLAILNNLARKDALNQNISEYVRHFSEYDSCPHVKGLLKELQETLKHYSANKLISMDKEKVGTKAFIEQHYGFLRDFFVEAMQGDSPEKKHGALAVVRILADNKCIMTEAEPFLEKIMEDIGSVFFASAFYALEALVENGQACDLGKRTVKKLSQDIKTQGDSIQINFLSILIDIFEDDLKDIAQTAVVELADSRRPSLLDNVCMLLTVLIEKGHAPKEVQTIVFKLQKAPVDSLKPWIEKLEAALSTQDSQ